MFAKSLVLYIVMALGLVSSVAQAEVVGSAHRRAHRLLKPRMPATDPADPDQGTVGAAAAPPPADPSVVLTTTYAANDPLHLFPQTGLVTLSATSTTKSVLATSTPTPSVNPSLTTHKSSTTLSSSSSSLNSTTSSSAASSTSTDSDKSSTSSEDASSTTTAAPSSETEPGTVIVSSTKFVTASAGNSGNSTSSASTPQGSLAAALPEATRNVLIGIGASIAGVIIIWTIIRKWKFNKSRRTTPINWDPNMDEANRDYDATHIRRQSGASSFRSGIGNEDVYGSDPGHPAASYPERDFTSGTGHTAPIGGYADLSRDTASPTPSVYDQHAPVSYPQNAAYDYSGHGPRF